MNLLATEELAVVHRIHDELRCGDSMSQQGMEALARDWEHKISPPDKGRAEFFAVCDVHGAPTGVSGPRWLFHLFGLRHRAAEIALCTERGLIVVQRRSPLKDQWPGAWDMAVAGHVSQNDDGSAMSFEDGAWKEIEEEIGLSRSEAGVVFTEGKLTAVGAPYFCLEDDLRRNPPFFDAEVRQIFAATLTGAGLSRLHFPDKEAAGILLVTPESAWRLIREEAVASGLRYSLPRYLDWLVRQKCMEQK